MLRKNSFAVVSMVLLLALTSCSVLFLQGCGDKGASKKEEAIADSQSATWEYQETGSATQGKTGKTSKTSSTDKATSSSTEPTEPTQSKQTSSTQVKENETEIVGQTALSDAKTKSPDLAELKVLEVKIIDNWARVVLEPVDKSTDAATSYLKKTNGTWTVFDFGTGITPESHPEAPPELFQ